MLKLSEIGWGYPRHYMSEKLFKTHKVAELAWGDLMSIKKYMIIDFITLFVIGTIVEMVAMYVIPRTIPNATPMFCASVLILLVAQARWGYKGLVLAPFMACSSVVSAMLLGKDSLGWEFYLAVFISDLVGLLSSSVILLFRKKNKRDALFGEILTTIYQVLIVLGLILVVQSIIMVVAEFIFNSNANVLSRIGWVVIQSLPGAFITIIMIIPLRHQKALFDVKQDLISKQEEKEMERKYYSQYANEVIDKTGQNKKD